MKMPNLSACAVSSGESPFLIFHIAMEPIIETNPRITKIIVKVSTINISQSRIGSQIKKFLNLGRERLSDFHECSFFHS
jgi:hypothetical protein